MEEIEVFVHNCSKCGEAMPYAIGIFTEANQKAMRTELAALRKEKESCVFKTQAVAPVKEDKKEEGFSAHFTPLPSPLFLLKKLLPVRTKQKEETKEIKGMPALRPKEIFELDPEERKLLGLPSINDVLNEDH